MLGLQAAVEEKPDITLAQLREFSNAIRWRRKCVRLATRGPRIKAHAL